MAGVQEGGHLLALRWERPVCDHVRVWTLLPICCIPESPLHAHLSPQASSLLCGVWVDEQSWMGAVAGLFQGRSHQLTATLYSMPSACHLGQEFVQAIDCCLSAWAAGQERWAECLSLCARSQPPASPSTQEAIQGMLSMANLQASDSCLQTTWGAGQAKGSSLAAHGARKNGGGSGKSAGKRLLKRAAKNSVDLDDYEEEQDHLDACFKDSDYGECHLCMGQGPRSALEGLAENGDSSINMQLSKLQRASAQQNPRPLTAVLRDPPVSETGPGPHLVDRRGLRGGAYSPLTNRMTAQ